ncbi:hypothetical protein KAJ26_07190, partial [bacterium]|nr:hypothetical protein [bacterium]
MKRQIPLMLVLALGIIYFFVPLVSTPWVVDNLQHEVYEKWLKIIGVFAVIMSVASLWRRNAVKIKRKSGDYAYSYLELIGMVLMAALAIIAPRWNIGNGMVLGGIGGNSVYNWIFMNMQVPMQATMFSMLAFYIASAAYRSFRARNIEATLLLITAAIVMIGRVPLGEDIYQFMLKLNGGEAAGFQWSRIFDFQG